MNIVSFQVAKFLFNLGYRELTMYKYSKKTEDRIFWFQGSDSDYSAPTYEDAIEFLWKIKIAQIYCTPCGSGCKGVVCVPNLNKTFTTKHQFPSPSEAYVACMNILISKNESILLC